jgi:hypothetical protein
MKGTRFARLVKGLIGIKVENENGYGVTGGALFWDGTKSGGSGSERDANGTVAG